MSWRSALYSGSVTHRRVRPRAHKLRYNIYNMLFDLDELDALGSAMTLFSRNRFNLFSFYDRDHGEGGADLRAYVNNLLRTVGIAPEGGAVRVLCSPRVLGYVFNPLTTYFCYWPDASLCAILYEVNNTFGQRHSYFIPVPEGHSTSGGALHQHCDKAFYVSPFLDMAMRYRFRIIPPESSVSIGIHAADAQGLVLAAAFAGRRGGLSDKALLRAFFAYPLLTFKIIAGIYWEGLKLLGKGLRIRQRPEPPKHAVTIVVP
ncbi:MAG TPA: DUF1365 family protein [Acidocella sp.]|nr:DUF1365 family protein [Acidocella sp.]